MSLYSELASSLLKMFPNVALGKIPCVTLRIKDNLARKYSISTEIRVPFLPALPSSLEGARQRLVRREGLEDPPRRIELSALFKLIGKDNSFRMHIVNGDK